PDDPHPRRAVPGPPPRRQRRRGACRRGARAGSPTSARIRTERALGSRCRIEVTYGPPLQSPAADGIVSATMSPDREGTEREARACCEHGDARRAAEIAIRGYGPEILGFLTALLRRDEDADEVFSLWCERMLRGLPKFAWACSLRTFAYANARNAASNFGRDR